MSAAVDLSKAPGHEVLAAAGKTMLRPGGKAATEQLLAWGNMQPGQTVLELASSFGYTAIALAQRFGVRVVGIEKNPDSVARARANIAAAGLEEQVSVVEGSIFHLDEIEQQFDFVIAEAIITMQSSPAKRKIIDRYLRSPPTRRHVSLPRVASEFRIRRNPSRFIPNHPHQLPTPIGNRLDEPIFRSWFDRTATSNRFYGIARPQATGAR
jgi:hypothetical protein